MSGFLRPEAVARLRQWREVLAGLVGVALGIWLATGVGYVQQGLGAALTLFAAGFTLIALRRLRFAGRADAPGVVKIDEGEITYFAPELITPYGTPVGGAIARAALTELRLRTQDDRHAWILISSEQILTIPHDATGADQLFDMFSALPDLAPGQLIAALNSAQPGTITVWSRRHPIA